MSTRLRPYENPQPKRRVLNKYFHSPPHVQPSTSSREFGVVRHEAITLSPSRLDLHVNMTPRDIFLTMVYTIHIHIHIHI